MPRILSALLLSSALVSLPALVPAAQAFCGFYVAKADAKLFNKASKVVVARSGQRTAVTMASDYQGDPKEFALVIPVPTVVTKEQISIVENATVDHLDAYTAPRLVEYFDPDPCAAPPAGAIPRVALQAAAPAPGAASKAREAALGVKIEAQYTVGEYDIVILSATQSDGLTTYLNEEGYKIPAGAAPVLGSYIKQNMKFFLAKVNLKEQAKAGAQFLRPIQVAYDTPKFMLPIRLGTVNADGPQDMIMLFLSEKGRVETTNYRTVRLPSNVEVPIYTKAEFGKFYTALFGHQVAKDGMKNVYLEYAWDMGWCDPCAADPVPDDKLASLGATWVKVPERPTQTQPDPGAAAAFQVKLRDKQAEIAKAQQEATLAAQAAGLPGAGEAAQAKAWQTQERVKKLNAELANLWRVENQRRQAEQQRQATSQPQVRRLPPNQGTNVFVTRLHVRYDANNFPEDLVFQETADRSNFQGRYILRHPFTGEAKCSAGEDYLRSLGLRFEKEAATLAHLTGWDIGEIRKRMGETGQKPR